MYLNFNFLTRYTQVLLKGAALTVIISVLSLILGFILGLVMALLRRSKYRFLRNFAGAWVEFLRNTPFLVQLFFLYFGLPELGINTDPIVTSILALGINTSAPNCEVIRSGLMAVKKGYYETSYALGYSPFQTFYYFVLPISLRIAFKPLTSNFINLVLTSSVAFSVTVNELMGVSKTIAAQTSRPFEVYIFIMFAYCVFTFILSFVSKAIDRKISITL
ncbi:amino acid ABC transporter permease [Breznakiella homolactica]|uniref:Amino acid ABC transporter permease n=1 Tax=Breznakiella homolactica TaxID=2798577 RepID=A0A7T8BAT9_9SPIR|nr:amino acid ABC transporter permease [Breznakiella homolactica]QQO11089.1 amino acid ABC transporter permease [Breznakiella homolactica]